jgi:hypothetical protein
MVLKEELDQSGSTTGYGEKGGIWSLLLGKL